MFSYLYDQTLVGFKEINNENMETSNHPWDHILSRPDQSSLSIWISQFPVGDPNKTSSTGVLFQYFAHGSGILISRETIYLPFSLIILNMVWGIKHNLFLNSLPLISFCDIFSTCNL